MDVESDATFVQGYTSQPSRCRVKFFPEWKRNNFQSEKEGKEIGKYEDRIMILIPGQKDVVVRPVQDKDKREYPQEWTDYQAGRDQRITGTPIELLPGLPKSRADLLKSLYIYSIEQLADLAEPGMLKLGMGAVELKNKAQAFLQKNSAEVNALKMELQKRDEVIAQQQAQLAAFEERLKALESTPRRGRPPKQPAITQ